MNAEEKQKLEIDPADPIKGIYQKLRDMDEKIEKIQLNQVPTYSQISSQTINSNLNKIVNKINKERANNPEEEERRQERTLVIRHYEDKHTKSTSDIKRQINEEYPLTGIREARTTPGGSIVIEFEDKQTADKIEKSWKNSIFGGNQGLLRGNKPRNTGIIYHVLKQNKSEEEIEEEIKSQYPECEVDMFKRNGRFTGTIKIKFNNQEDYQNARANKIKIFSQSCFMSEFEFRPRVVTCGNCQKYGHITRLCRSNTVCGQCKSEEHSTENCDVDEEHYKCHQCDGNHPTFHKSCVIQKAKVEQIRSRFNNGW